MKKITKAEYVEKYNPLGAFILVEKHRLEEKVGSIYLAQTAVDKHVKTAMTGVVVAKSKFEQFENPMDQYFMSQVQVGDVIGFSATVPLLSPMPPDLSFDGENQYYTLHVGDILCKFT